MSKYYKAEDVIHTLADQWLFEAEAEGPYSPNDIEEYKEIARRLFSDIPTIEVSEDCISRKWLEEHIEVVSYTNEWHETEIDEFVSWKNIDTAPSVVPTTEQSSMVGEWKKEVNEKLGKCLRVVYVCSTCGCAVGCENFVRRSYCPNCGAKMKGAE